MDTKKLKINIPEGYEIDRENSTFEEIVFKKKVDPFSRLTISKLPKTWEEYCKHVKGHTTYYGDSVEGNIYTANFSKFYNEFSTKKRTRQYIALGRLLQLRDYWVKDRNFVNGIGYSIRRYMDYLITDKCNADNYALTFPTQEMAQKFIEYFEDLINEASPLVLK